MGILFFKILATYLPCCIATGATPGSGFPSSKNKAASPITKTLGSPGIVQSLSTITCPARFVSASRVATTGATLLPAAQIIFEASINSSPIITPFSFTSFTIELTLTSTPKFSKDFRALLLNFLSNVCRILSAPSTSIILVSAVFIFRKSLSKVSLAISANAPATSTPVGPPPTMTNVISFCFSFSVFVSSAFSNAKSIRSRIFSASETVFKPGANFSQLSFPKYECLFPAATTKKSYS